MPFADMMIHVDMVSHVLKIISLRRLLQRAHSTLMGSSRASIRRMSTERYRLLRFSFYMHTLTPTRGATE